MPQPDAKADEKVGWTCKARPTADPPQDCDWPNCGCDPYANKVLDALDIAAHNDVTMTAMITDQQPGTTSLIAGDRIIGGMPKGGKK